VTVQRHASRTPRQPTTTRARADAQGADAGKRVLDALAFHDYVAPTREAANGRNR
jgi:hypothetical protein